MFQRKINKKLTSEEPPKMEEQEPPKMEEQEPNKVPKNAMQIMPVLKIKEDVKLLDDKVIFRMFVKVLDQFQYQMIGNTLPLVFNTTSYTNLLDYFSKNSMEIDQTSLSLFGYYQDTLAIIFSNVSGLYYYNQTDNNCGYTISQTQSSIYPNIVLLKSITGANYNFTEIVSGCKKVRCFPAYTNLNSGKIKIDISSLNNLFIITKTPKIPKIITDFYDCGICMENYKNPTNLVDTLYFTTLQSYAINYTTTSIDVLKGSTRYSWALSYYEKVDGAYTYTPLTEWFIADITKIRASGSDKFVDITQEVMTDFDEKIPYINCSSYGTFAEMKTAFEADATKAVIGTTYNLNLMPI